MEGLQRRFGFELFIHVPSKLVEVHHPRASTPSFTSQFNLLVKKQLNMSIAGLNPSLPTQSLMSMVSHF